MPFGTRWQEHRIKLSLESILKAQKIIEDSTTDIDIKALIQELKLEEMKEAVERDAQSVDSFEILIEGYYVDTSLPNCVDDIKKTEGIIKDFCNKFSEENNLYFSLQKSTDTEFVAWRVTFANKEIMATDEN